MTREQARTEADRRWGARSFTQHAWRKTTDQYEVGRVEGPFPKVYGRGSTWEEAFADADKREERA